MREGGREVAFDSGWRRWVSGSASATSPGRRGNTSPPPPPLPCPDLPFLPPLIAAPARWRRCPCLHPSVYPIYTIHAYIPCIHLCHSSIHCPLLSSLLCSSPECYISSVALPDLVTSASSCCGGWVISCSTPTPK